MNNIKAVLCGLIFLTSAGCGVAQNDKTNNLFRKQVHKQKLLVTAQSYLYVTLSSMAIKKTVLIGEPVLRETAKKVNDINDSYIQQVIENCINIMKKENLLLTDFSKII